MKWFVFLLILSFIIILPLIDSSGIKIVGDRVLSVTQVNGSSFNETYNEFAYNQSEGITSTPAGLDGEVQFNDGGSFGADDGLFWDDGNKRLGIETNTPTHTLDIAGDINEKVEVDYTASLGINRFEAKIHGNTGTFSNIVANRFRAVLTNNGLVNMGVIAGNTQLSLGSGGGNYQGTYIGHLYSISSVSTSARWAQQATALKAQVLGVGDRAFWIKNMRGLDILVSPQSSSAETTDLAEGIFISMSKGGAITVTDAYGIRIEDINIADNNYAIKTGLGLVEFGDNTEIIGNLTIEDKITFRFGEFIENIREGWLRITGNLEVDGNISLEFGDLVSEQNPDGADAIRIKGTDYVDVVIGGMTGLFAVWNVADNTPVFFVNERGDTDIAGDLTFGFGEIIDNIVDGWIRVTGSLNVIGDINQSGNFTGNQIYGETNIHPDGNFTVVIDTQDEHVNITGFDDFKLNGFILEDDALVAQVAGVYSADFWLSTSGGVNDIYESCITVNGIHETPHAHRKQGTPGDVGSMSGGGIINLSVGDRINLEIRNIDSTADVTIFYAGMRFERIGN